MHVGVIMKVKPKNRNKEKSILDKKPKFLAKTKKAKKPKKKAKA